MIIHQQKVVSEDIINNVIATNAIMVYFRKGATLQTNKFFFRVPYWSQRVSIRPVFSSHLSPLYMYTLFMSSVEMKTINHQM